MDKLPMKFLAFNVDFDGLSLDFLGFTNTAHEGIKKRYTLVKVVILPLLVSNCYRLSRVS